ncbi:MAG: ferric reductase-like transmembrane domain-containing protein [Actinomycetota bacterium]
MSDQFFWFATRSAGIMAWFAASFSILVGLLIPTRALGKKPTIPWLTDLHRYFGAMSVVFLVVHMVTLWLDEFVKFRLDDLLIPFVAEVGGLSRWSLALGVIAAWFLFAIEATSLIRKRLPKRVWHTIHLTSFGVMIAGAVHGIAAGSDTDNALLLAAMASVSMAIGILTLIRVGRIMADDRRQRAKVRDKDDAQPWDAYGAEEPAYAGNIAVGARAGAAAWDDGARAGAPAWDDGGLGGGGAAWDDGGRAGGAAWSDHGGGWDDQGGWDDGGDAGWTDDWWEAPHPRQPNGAAPDAPVTSGSRIVGDDRRTPEPGSWFDDEDDHWRRRR